jgi:Txe/YoeB family toxin of Txe-Axe toxin-antitoxin module
MKTPFRLLSQTAFMALFAALLLITACSNPPEEVNVGNPEADSLRALNRELSDELSEKDSSLESFISDFNEIQENLDNIKARQKILSKSTSSGDNMKNYKEQIIADIQSINSLLDNNRSKIAALNEKLKNSDIKVEGLQQMIERLNREIEEKDEEIASLKSQLERSNLQVADLKTKLNEKSIESDKKTEALNTAYFAIGTTKELKEKGVLTKEGGFIGIGKTKKLKEDFNRDYFTRIDVTKRKEFDIDAKKIRVVTTHPASSYMLTGDKRTEKLVVTNVNDFWSASKYLVIVIEKD